MGMCACGGGGRKGLGEEWEGGGRGMRTGGMRHACPLYCEKFTIKRKISIFIENSHSKENWWGAPHMSSLL